MQCFGFDVMPPKCQEMTFSIFFSVVIFLLERVGSLLETNSGKAPENVWLEYYRFLFGWPPLIFRGKMAVSFRGCKFGGDV